MTAYIKEDQMAIWDPNCIPGEPNSQLSRLASMETVMVFIKALRSPPASKVEEFVYGSGGGNVDSTQCNEMCKQWLIEQIITRKGGDLGRWEELGWGRYKSN
ncbi:hypothetical protein FN846DRAFT_1025939 [Sphaerosporella brunnea]|uniref:Uncharacterized protein n=1 Tax=Sphaerosporella brunnea TaxID=1250544 RepID=A0A5J5ECB2_9PEZI|nr:hypothetical protein FN846DRAFT_1025939 [Sphaerosporella brunnea]